MPVDQAILSAELRDNMSESAEKIADSLGRVQDAGEGVLGTNEKLEKSQRSIQASYDRLERSLDPLVRVNERYEKDLKRIQLAEESLRKSGQLTEEQTRRLEKSRELLQERFERESKSVDKVAQDYDRLKRSLDPLAGATERLQREQETLRKVFERGDIGLDEYEDQLKRVQRGYDEYARKVNKAEKETKDFDKTLGVAKSTLIGLATGLLAGFSFDAFISGTRDAVAALDDIAKRARGLGGIEQAEFIQKTTFALGQLGIETERAEKGLATLDKRVGELSRGFGSLKGPLEQFAPDVIDKLLQTNNVEERFAIILDLLNQVEDAGQRAAIASAAFDTELGKSLGALGETSIEKLKELQQEAVDAGLVLDKEILERSEDLNEQFTLLSKQIDVNLKEAFVALGPIVLAILTATRDITKEVTDYLANVTTASNTGSFNSISEIPTLREAEAAVEKLEKDIDRLEAKINSNPDKYTKPLTNDLELARRRLEVAEARVNQLTASSIQNIEDLGAAILDAGTTAGEGIQKAFDLSDLDKDIKRLQDLNSAFDEGSVAFRQKERELDIQKELDKLQEQADKAQEKFSRAKTKELLEQKQLLEDQLNLNSKILSIENSVLELKDIARISNLPKEEYELALQRLDIEREIKLLKDEAAVAGIDFNEQAVRSALEQEAALERLIDANREFSDELSGVVDQFVDDLVFEGENAFENLAKSAKRIFFDILLDPLKNALASLLSGIFNGGSISIQGGGFGLPIGGASGLGVGGQSGLPGAGAPGLNFGALASSLGTLGVIGGGQALGAGSVGTVLGLGSLLGSGGVTNLLTNGVNSIFGAKTAAGFGNFLSGSGFDNAFSLGGAVGGIGGSLLSGALFGKSTSQSVGSTIGSIAGSFIPVIGQIPVLGQLVGSFIGGAIGSLFAGKPSDNTAQGVFNIETGKIVGVNQDGSAADPNAKIRDEIISQISNVSKLFNEQFGFLGSNPSSTTANEAFLNVAVRQDRKTGEQLIELGYQSPSGEPVGGGRFAATEAGAEEAVRKGIELAIDSFRGGDETLLKLAKALNDVGEPVEDIVSTLETVDNLLQSNNEKLSVWQERIKGINDQFDPVLSKLEKAGADTSELLSVRDELISRVGDDFREALQVDINNFTNPLLNAVKDISDNQIQLFEDARDLGIETSLVMERNTLEWKAFIEQAASTPEALEAVTEAIQKINERATELGLSPSLLDQFATDAFNLTGDAFRETLERDILGLVNAPLANFKALLESQQKFIETANSLAELNPQRFGDLPSLVTNRNALQIQGFFDSLSDEDKLRLGDFIGLIEDFSGRMQVVAVQLRDVLTSATQDFQESLSALETQFEDSTQAARTLREARLDLTDRYFPGSQQDRLSDIEARLNDAFNSVISGDTSRVDEFTSLAEKFITGSFEAFGSSIQATNNRDRTLDLLQRAEDAQQLIADQTENEIDILKNGFEVNKQILDAVSSTSDQTDFLEMLLNEGKINNDLVKSLVEEMITLRNLQQEQNLYSVSSLASVTDPNSIATINTQQFGNLSQTEVVFAVGEVDTSINSGFNNLVSAVNSLTEEVKSLRSDNERLNQELQTILNNNEETVNTTEQA